MSLPRYGDSVIDPSGRFSVPWFRFFERLSGKGPAAETVSVTGSPKTIAIGQNGFLTVSGGTVSAIEYRRGTSGAFASIGATSGPVPVRNGDSVKITYTVAPTVTFYAD